MSARSGFASALLVFALCLQTSAFGGEAPIGLEGPVQGITISTHRGGRDWGSDEMPLALASIQMLGANWVAIHPYARIGANGSVSTRSRRNPEPEAVSSSIPPEHIARPIREAKALGMKILIKPHLAYWGSPFGWRGDIAFDNEEDWARFWRDYEKFILQLAEWSEGADGFVVGTELRGTIGHQAEWRALIAKVRARTSVPLTYAANWDDYERVGFWDVLDVIGVQAYFPLTQAEDRSEQAIRDGWKRWMTTLSSYSRRLDRPVLFTELGYNRAHNAPVEPWDYTTDDEEAESIQATCMRVALEAIRAEPSVVGAFLWKWFIPPREVGRNFQLATPRMRDVIQQQWRPSGSDR